MTNSNDVHFNPNVSLFLQLKEKMIEIYGEVYYKYHKDDEPDERKYIPAKSSVARSILVSLYNQFLITGECDPIEKIPTENKKYYWDISKGMTDSKQVMINCSISMYVLDLITNNFKPCQKSLSSKEIAP